MKNKSLALWVCLLLAAPALAAQSGPRGLSGGRHAYNRGAFFGEDFLPARLVLRAKERIGLSEDQEKKISALAESHALWAVKFGAEMRVKALEIRAAAGKSDFAKAEKLIRDQAGMRAEMQIARLRLQKEIQALLTPEQKSRLAGMKRDFRGRSAAARISRNDRRRWRRN